MPAESFASVYPVTTPGNASTMKPGYGPSRSSSAW